MRARKDFILDWQSEVLSFSELCRRHGISRKTGYKWISRYDSEREGGLEDRSRRPKKSPKRTSEKMEGLVLAIRRAHPSWGGRKIRQVLLNDGVEGPLPAPSTVSNILRRSGLLGAGTREGVATYQRFERSEPNDLWQMDFKGHFGVLGGDRCYPLTMLDDYSRYNLVLKACGNEQRVTVQRHLEECFRRYGLPRQILCDHGNPWGKGLASDGDRQGYTQLGMWLMRLGIDVFHGKVRHPQTQGKEERFHRTLKAEVLMRTLCWEGLEHCQREFDAWREIYNEVRPHEALDLECPVSRYRPSPRSYPETLVAAESYYLEEDELRRVGSRGEILFGNHHHAIGAAFIGEQVALRASGEGRWDLYFCWKKLGVIDLTGKLNPKGRINVLQKA